MDKLYRVVIIDDDEFSADNLCLELKKYNRLSIDGMARNGANGRKLLEKVHPDLLFLDVELPDMKGMELLEQLRGAITWNMQIVFYTAYDKYMNDNGFQDLKDVETVQNLTFQREDGASDIVATSL